MSEKIEKDDSGIKIRNAVEFNTDMISEQQEALQKTMTRYEQRDNPIEQLVETVTVKAVDAFLTVNQKIVDSLPNETRLKVQDTWQKIMLSF